MLLTKNAKKNQIFKEFEIEMSFLFDSKFE